MTPFAFVEARSLAEAAAAGSATVTDAMVAAPGTASVIKAGGIDLLGLMKEELLAPARIVNLRHVPDLSAITTASDGALRIGAAATLAEIAGHADIRARYHALAEAAARVGSPQIRNVGTIGGNLLQRPRCWYFRSTQHLCTRKGGTTCFAFGGENKYHAIFDHHGCAIVHPSSVASVLVAFGAVIRLAGAQGAARDVTLEDFFVLPEIDPHRENRLAAGEVVSEIVLPSGAPTRRSVYLARSERASFDWPLADVAVVADFAADGRCADAAIVLGAAAPVPHRARAAEAALKGKRIDRNAAAAAATAALVDAAPLSQNGYKLPLFQALITDAVLTVGGRT